MSGAGSSTPQPSSTVETPKSGGEDSFWNSWLGDSSTPKEAKLSTSLESESKSEKRTRTSGKLSLLESKKRASEKLGLGKGRRKLLKEDDKAKTSSGDADSTLSEKVTLDTEIPVAKKSPQSVDSESKSSPDNISIPVTEPISIDVTGGQNVERPQSEEKSETKLENVAVLQISEPQEKTAESGSLQSSFNKVDSPVCLDAPPEPTSVVEKDIALSASSESNIPNKDQSKDCHDNEMDNVELIGETENQAWSEDITDLDLSLVEPENKITDLDLSTAELENEKQDKSGLEFQDEVPAINESPVAKIESCNENSLENPCDNKTEMTQQSEEQDDDKISEKAEVDAEKSDSVKAQTEKQLDEDDSLLKDNSEVTDKKEHDAHVTDKSEECDETQAEKQSMQISSASESGTTSEEVEENNKTLTEEDFKKLGVLNNTAKENTGDTPTNKDESSTGQSLTASGYVKNMLEEAMVESVKESDSHSDRSSDKSSDLVRIESGINSGHTSGDEIDTTTSSDIEIISTPTPNGDNRISDRPFDLSPLRHALTRTVRRGSPPGHRRSDSGSSAQSNWSKSGDDLLSPDSLLHRHLEPDTESYQQGKTQIILHFACR